MANAIQHRGCKPSFSLRERVDQGGWVIHRTMQFQEMTRSVLLIEAREVAGQCPKILGLKTPIKRGSRCRKGRFEDAIEIRRDHRTDAAEPGQPCDCQMR